MQSDAALPDADVAAYQENGAKSVQCRVYCWEIRYWDQVSYRFVAVCSVIRWGRIAFDDPFNARSPRPESVLRAWTIKEGSNDSDSRFDRDLGIEL